jgi:ABC-type polysaccharide/polyol phosphate export permease
MYYLIEVFRQPAYGGVLPSAGLLMGASVISFVTLALGWIVFSSRADEFTYRI